MKPFSIFLFFILTSMNVINGADQPRIRISTDDIDLILTVADNGRLYQTYLGQRLLHDNDINNLPDGKKNSWEAYAASGAEDYFEPALAVTHNDGNMTTILHYISSETHQINANATETILRLKDKAYPVEVTLHYTAFAKENVIKTWTEIKHKEKHPVKLWRYASSILYLESPSYHLAEYSGDWAKEMRRSVQQLQPGKKILETKLGTRAAMHIYPFFELGLGKAPDENNGTTMLGTIAWTGNFQFAFEVDDKSNLRIISAINPFASEYELKPEESFATPELIFTISFAGKGKASRNLHNWAREYQVKDGQGDRLTLLNNWEATGFNFDERSLEGLMNEASELGVDIFLLDDGWFANKYPRADDRAGLGDWLPTKAKLPNGIPHLVRTAEKAGVKFGLWIEPEMVNPKSELFELHPEWVIRLPNRESYYFRNQMVLDLSNPKVQDYVFGIVDKIMSEQPAPAYLKWDCNSPITNIYSPYLKEKQNQLYINHTQGVYNVFRRVKDKYPNLPMMLCAGGGARCDYEALKYFTEFWCSDNTDPVERIYIQWAYSQFLPVKTMAAHVTSANKKTSIKFRTDVAMMCKLGFDIRTKDLNEKELAYCKTAVANYKRLKNLIFDGDLYRLVSPDESNHAAVSYASLDKTHALLLTYDIHPRFGEKLLPIKLQGLDPDRLYKVEEINLLPDAGPQLGEHGRTLSGDYLMKVGLNAFSTSQTNSKVIELTSL